MSLSVVDLAGHCVKNPHYLQTRKRINSLIDRYLSLEVLIGHLVDLPRQFKTPQPRPWQRIYWSEINGDQIIGVDPEIFVSIVANATEIEAPIQDYAAESMAYLAEIHPDMASFVGGIPATETQKRTVGIWEKEERQHTPVFKKIHQKLTGELPPINPNTVTGYQSTGDRRKDLKHHLHGRISTEWSATSIYLWLMAHSTGELQKAIAQPLQDEVNHLAKFWGFSRWAFGDSYLKQVKFSTKNLLTLANHHHAERTDADNLLNEIAHFEELPHIIELGFTFMRVMVRLGTLNQELSHSFLQYLFQNNEAIAI
ncbi:hypothetical protein Lepto7376_3562 [[Leptolyngbya] sp. PCC 7376]|uniref:hypothetical protein n=1 Tax=[Leptolyngbya] sp. PCC 7376 TaxID=111781 RepID=UPI00029EDAAE|nr:hypothetical protein [[Leptolyngbya] sp. PCC 7376]AFY39753.1 hypothetical protein Lepto7376_3562 [[Leptolyngbya] sp. PCC 7376]